MKHQIPTRSSLRRVLMAVLRTDSDLQAFCIDHYPTIAARFGNNMDRLVKFNLLLSEVSADEILECLKEYYSETVSPYEGLIEFGDGKDILPSALLDARDRRNRQRMIERVRKFWIEGVLEKSLHSGLQIELGKKYRPDVVVYHWDMILQRSDTVPEPIARGTKMIKLFDENIGELLILGKPGSGKTTMLLDLCRDLIMRASNDETQPIPVVFNLSSWGQGRLPLHQWVIKELERRYDVPPLVGNQWITTSQVVPLFDGLDETEESLRSECISAINKYKKCYPVHGIIVCCRTEDYLQCQEVLSLHVGIELTPPNQTQIFQYLTQSGHSGQAVLTLIQQKPEVLELASTPLMLDILLQTAGDRQFLEIDKGASWERALFEIYCQRALRHRSRPMQIGRLHTFSYLRNLSIALIAQKQNVFYLEDLSLDYINPKRLQKDQTFVFALIFWVIFTSFQTLVSGMFLPKYQPSAGTYALEIVTLFFNPIMFVPLLSLIYAIMTTVALKGYPVLTLENIEKIKWSWSEARKSFVFGIKKSARFSARVFLMAICLLIALTLFSSVPAPASITACISLSIGSFGVCAVLLIPTIIISRSIFVVELSTRTSPNRGIHRSLMASIFLMGITTFCISINNDLGILSSVLIALIQYALSSLAPVLGGIAVSRHYSIRVLSAIMGILPLRLVPFLNTCMIHVLMHRVGGGYMFIHRYLMEYFASLSNEDIQRLQGRLDTVADDRRR